MTARARSLGRPRVMMDASRHADPLPSQGAEAADGARVAGLADQAFGGAAPVRAVCAGIAVFAANGSGSPIGSRHDVAVVARRAPDAAVLAVGGCRAGRRNGAGELFGHHAGDGAPTRALLTGRAVLSDRIAGPRPCGVRRGGIGSDGRGAAVPIGRPLVIATAEHGEGPVTKTTMHARFIVLLWVGTELFGDSVLEVRRSNGLTTGARLTMFRCRGEGERCVDGFHRKRCWQADARCFRPAPRTWSTCRPNRYRRRYRAGRFSIPCTTGIAPR